MFVCLISGRQNIDQIKQYQERVQQTLREDRKLARELLKNGKTE
jgi:hypothetical protein